MLWEGDARQFAKFIAAGEMPREIQLEIARLLTTPENSIFRLKIEVSEREARRFLTALESAANGVEVDLASGGGKRDAGVHTIRAPGKGRSKLFADRALLREVANAFRDAHATWSHDEREAFQEAWSAGDPAVLTLLEEMWRLSRKSSPRNRG